MAQAGNRGAPREAHAQACGIRKKGSRSGSRGRSRWNSEGIKAGSESPTGGEKPVRRGWGSTQKAASPPRKLSPLLSGPDPLLQRCGGDPQVLGDLLVRP